MINAKNIRTNRVKKYRSDIYYICIEPISKNNIKCTKNIYPNCMTIGNIFFSTHNYHITHENMLTNKISRSSTKRAIVYFARK